MSYGPAFKGAIETLRLLMGAGCPVDWVTMNNAVKNGHAECVQLLQEANCPTTWVLP